ncbi:uncharacterized protein LOC124255968 [Haliotis rubra]|uniref:uncharacterized protein LOC124255968 n=1 Tax=Haliotis rubra TaxID=36100 RepID=UPI001EE5D1C2|nr:uncharacterized protein LOC124255968 [Haliotis rubra]XP_046545873.1 uncharacterized protein LOC124255968 [Haliotis rubra]XP_046545874.1 uncharacterized protein LOC124255968 [Haliotis rubra]
MTSRRSILMITGTLSIITMCYVAKQPTHLIPTASRNVTMASSGLLVPCPSDVTMCPSNVTMTYPSNVTMTYPSNVTEMCPSVLRGMLSGSWKTRPLTESEENEMDIFQHKVLSRLRVSSSASLELPDKRCGNISYPGDGWFRALCEPRGTTPCCYGNVCQMRTVEDCVCDGCYDLRPQIQAEYSTWIPHDGRCKIETLTSVTACQLLRGGTYHFYGDSLVRQMFLAFIIILKGDKLHGGLRPDAPQDVKRMCAGMYVFPARACRKYIDITPTLCNGTVKAVFRAYPRASSITAMVKDVKHLLDKRRSIILYGCGLWKFFNTQTTEKYAMAVINTVNHAKNRTWPKLVWSGFHQFGIWRRPFVKGVDNEHAEKFNRHMAMVAERYNVPVFDTFNMTRGVHSVDGTHYGAGVNFLKAHIYINYIKELKTQGKWE